MFFTLQQWFVSLNGAVKIVISVLSSIITLISFVKLFDKGKNTKSKIRFGVLGCVWLMIVFFATTGTLYTIVPDVVDYYYSDAITLLKEKGLNYDPQRGENGLFVKSHNPKSGEIVRKGSTVSLTLETIVPKVTDHTVESAQEILEASGLQIGDSIDKRSRIIEQNPKAGDSAELGTVVEIITGSTSTSDDYKKGNLAISFRETEIQLRDDQNGELRELYGKVIDISHVNHAYLIDLESGNEYSDYSREDNALFFRDIPQGITLQLNVEFDKYEPIKTDVKLSAENMNDGIFLATRYTFHNESPEPLPARLCIIDNNGNAIKNKKVNVAWLDNITYSGDYYTRDDGQLNYTIYVTETRPVNIRILDPFGNGLDYECSVMLRRPEDEQGDGYDIVVLNPNGEIEVLRSTIYYQH